MRASAASASLACHLAARDRAVETEAARSSRARGLRRAPRARCRNTRRRRPRARTPARCRHPSRPRRARRSSRHGSASFAEKSSRWGRSMRASQSPGASSSGRGRHHRLVGPEPVQLVERAVAAFHHAAAERGAGLVVAAVELEARAGDRRSRSRRRARAGAAATPRRGGRARSPCARRSTRRRRRCSPRARTTNRCSSASSGRLAFGAHRTEQHVGVGEALDRLHRRRVGGVEAAELTLHRFGLDLVRADVVAMRTAADARAPMAPHVARRARPHAARARIAARRPAATIPARTRRRCAR